MAKPRYKSKTVWFNTAVAAAMLAAATDALPMLEATMSPEAYAWASFIAALVNVYLRQITTEPLE